MMVARSGMFVAPLAGTPPVGMSPTDGRIAFSALIGTTPQPASGGAITQSASTMAITVAAGVFQLPDVSNATGTSTFLSAIDQTTATPAAGPATGSRIDLICTKQNNVENSDADSRANHFLVAGVAGAPGVAPALPTGAYLYATVNVPSTVTNAAACTVVVARPSTFGPLKITCPTFALLSTFAGVANQKAYCPADGITYRWNGSAWKGWESDWIVFSTVVTPASGGFGGVTPAFRWKYASGAVLFNFTVTVNNIGTASGVITVTLPVTAVFGSGYGRESGLTGFSLSGAIAPGANTMSILRYDNGVPSIANGSIINIQGTIQV